MLGIFNERTSFFWNSSGVVFLREHYKKQGRQSMNKVFLLFLYVPLMLSFAACSSKAKITSSWIDPSLKGYSANNVLVMGVSKDETRLKLYENVFVDLFARNNVRAMASYKVIGTVSEPNRADVEAAIKKTGASSVLITNVVDKKSETHTFRGATYYRPTGYYGYYGQAFTKVHVSGSDVTNTVVRLESRLYDVSTDSLVWSAESEAINPELLRTDFERLIGLLMADLKEKGLIR